MGFAIDAEPGRGPAANGPDDAALEGGPLELVWLGDADKGLDEFSAAGSASRAPWRTPSPDRPAGSDPAAAGLEEFFAPPPALDRTTRKLLRRVAAPTFVVLAGVALVSNLEWNAPGRIDDVLPTPPASSATGPAADAPIVETRDAEAAVLRTVVHDLPARVIPTAPPALDVVVAEARLTRESVIARAPRAEPAGVPIPRAVPETRNPPAPPPRPAPSPSALAPSAVAPPALAPPAVAPLAIETTAAPVARGAGTEPVTAPADTSAVPTAMPLAADTHSAPVPAGGEVARTVPVRELDTRAIEQVLSRYRAAFNRRDAGAAAEVWPTVDERALARAFDGLADQSVVFDQCQYDIATDSASAACKGTARYVPRVGSRSARTDARRWRFNLGRTAGRWTIVSVDAR